MTTVRLAAVIGLQKRLDLKMSVKIVHAAWFYPPTTLIVQVSKQRCCVQQNQYLQTTNAHIGKSTNALRSACRAASEALNLDAMAVSDEYWHRNNQKVRQRSTACLQMLLESGVVPWGDCMTEVADDARVACWVGLSEDKLRLTVHMQSLPCPTLKLHCRCVLARLADSCTCPSSGRRRRLDNHEKEESKKVKVKDASRDESAKRLVLMLRTALALC
eukprot:165558-Amphidinium_carterae.1